MAPRLVAETQSASAACAMAAAGLGFTIAEAVSLEPVAAEVAVRTLVPSVTMTVTVLGQSGRPLSTTAKRFLALVRSEIASDRFAYPKL